MVSNNDHYSPNFPKHRTSSKSHKHRLPIRPSNHLHLSSFDDVHLSADLTLTARAERDKSQFKMLTDKRFFHGGCLMWPLLRQPSNILAIYWDYWGFKMFLEASSKAHTVNHKKVAYFLLFYKQSLLEGTPQISACWACQISSVCHIPGKNRSQRL